MCDINICQKSYHILEVSCKMEISSIEEHISLALDAAPLIIVKKFYQFQNNLETTCVYLTHLNVFIVHYSLHVNTG